MGRRVAIKTLRGDALADPEFRVRFRAEAEAIARLQHPIIIQVFEVGLVDPSRDERYPSPFIAMEFVDGVSLAQHGKAPQTPREAAKMVGTLARAAHAAHQLGVVNRDLKPANVLLTRDEETEIADFGIAKQIDTDRATDGMLIASAAWDGTARVWDATSGRQLFVLPHGKPGSSHRLRFTRWAISSQLSQATALASRMRIPGSCSTGGHWIIPRGRTGCSRSVRMGNCSPSECPTA